MCKRSAVSWPKAANIAKVESRGKSHLTMPRPKSFYMCNAQI